MTPDIPVSVIVVTRNEADALPRCLSALARFKEIIVVDSGSRDGSGEIAARYGAQYVDYAWNGHYPKKRQWCLDTLPLKHERIFFVDADEVVTPALAEEIAVLSWERAGYFVRGRYVMDSAPLRFGLTNNKLALFDRRRVSFPVVDDLAIPGMGEIEGHYQPVPHDRREVIGQLRHALWHYAGDNDAKWRARHERYARWEAQMILCHAYPPETSALRAALKALFHHMPCRGEAAFIHSYLLKGGFMDGRRGLRFALNRRVYYRMVSRALSAASIEPAPSAAAPIPPTALQK